MQRKKTKQKQLVRLRFLFFFVCFCMNVYILVQMCVDILVLLNYYKKIKKKTDREFNQGL